MTDRIVKMKERAREKMDRNRSDERIVKVKERAKEKADTNQSDG